MVAALAQVWPPPQPSPVPGEGATFRALIEYRAFFEVTGRRRLSRFKEVALPNDGFDVAPSPGTGEGWGGGQTCAIAEIL